MLKTGGKKKKTNRKKLKSSGLKREEQERLSSLLEDKNIHSVCCFFAAFTQGHLRYASVTNIRYSPLGVC